MSREKQKGNNPDDPANRMSLFFLGTGFVGRTGPGLFWGFTDFMPELANALPKRLADSGQFAAAEENQCKNDNEENLCGSKSHNPYALLSSLFSAMRYPTPTSVKMYFGSFGLGSIFLRMLAMCTRSILLSILAEGPHNSRSMDL